ncbi:predicted protein [Naegleria gruberi]|uniref:Predicted protein n=1 Tax=Naegleria gruberi TaxID=5762 RepID=D2VBR9_NAEGR|nr:uncharacterized protein NAEGRDRAFT_66311 [Naegleria gruberi]EFC45955.1 predicted protein [Naegleria gruberi]|eukprot:XP_002678699.1 predicted protein [Naegleria gruberi strain NEG-M]
MFKPLFQQAFPKAIINNKPSSIMNSIIINNNNTSRRLFSTTNTITLNNTTIDHQQQHNIPIMRSLLYIPGNSEKMLSKIHSLSIKPDVFVPDLEDSVPYHEKEKARKMVREFLLSFNTQDNNANNMKIIPRVNSEDEFLEIDCESICIPNIVHAINIGKTSSIADIFKIDEILTRIEDNLKVQQYTFKIIPSIESAIGLVHAYQICSCLPNRIIGVAFGADDYAHDLGFTRNTSQSIEKELFYVRSTIAVAARAANIPSFDTPNVNFKNMEGLKEESIEVRNIGMKGKFAIHPNQIPILNEIFGPSEMEIKEAKLIVDAYEKAAQENNRGSCQVEGRMVDMPVYRRFKQVLEIAQKINRK